MEILSETLLHCRRSYCVEKLPLPRMGNEDVMERVDCQLCRSEEADLVFHERDRLHGIDGLFSLMQCRRCGLLYLNPRPTREEMVRHYPRDYLGYSTLHHRRSFLMRLDCWYGMRRRARAVLERTDSKGGKVLDIGCSTGEGLDAMRRLGDWEPYGVEINNAAAGYARDNLGLDVFPGTLLEAHYPDAFFDMVTMWNVLEHLHRPQDTLTEIARIVRPGGVLVISIPDPDCVEARILGRYWAGWDAPRHLTLYSRHTVSRALDLAGFDVFDTISFTGHHTVLALSLGFFLEEKLGKGRSTSCLKRAISSLPARLMTVPFYKMLDYWNKASVMTVLARRR